MTKVQGRGGAHGAGPSMTADCWLQATRLVASVMLLLLISFLASGVASACQLQLHVEKDTMNDVSAPDCGIFASAYEAAGRTVVFDTGQNNDGSAGHPKCTYDQNLEDSELAAYRNAYKGSTSTDQYWCIIISSAYCGPASMDYNPTSEPAKVGVTIGTRDYSWVFHETIRRYCADTGYNATTLRRRVALHETGHQFGTTKEDTSHDCVMSNNPPQENYFCTDCLAEVTQGGVPAGHPGP